MKSQFARLIALCSSLAFAATAAVAAAPFLTAANWPPCSISNPNNCGLTPGASGPTQCYNCCATQCGGSAACRSCCTQRGVKGAPLCAMPTVR